MRETTFIALLRGVNVGGHNRVPMAELRAACEDLGLREAQLADGGQARRAGDGGR